MKEKVIFVGAGGHCKILIESLDKNQYDIVGIIDGFSRKGSEVAGVSVIGSDEDAEHIFASGVHNAVISIVGNLKLRRKLLDKYRKIGFFFPNIIHPTAHISSSVRIGNGAAILAGACINAEAELRDFVTVNTGAIIEHEVLVDENSHVAPGAILLGACKIGKETMIGAGSIVLQQTKVGNNSMVGAGSVVLRDVTDEAIVYGNPAKEKRIL